MSQTKAGKTCGMCQNMLKAVRLRRAAQPVGRRQLQVGVALQLRERGGARDGGVLDHGDGLDRDRGLASRRHQLPVPHLLQRQLGVSRLSVIIDAIGLFHRLVIKSRREI